MGTVGARGFQKEEPAGPSHVPSAVESRALAAESGERRRIGQDLHDGTQQRLVVLAGGLSELIQLMDSDPSRLRRCVLPPAGKGRRRRQ